MNNGLKISAQVELLNDMMESILNDLDLDNNFDIDEDFIIRNAVGITNEYLILLSKPEYKEVSDKYLTKIEAVNEYAKSLLKN